MSDISDRIFEYSQKGYSCSQVMMLVILESEGKENPDMIRALGGLGHGVGGSGEVCGAFTGAMCCLNYYAGKGADSETANENLPKMSEELYDWFVDYTAEYGGINCRQIVDGDPRNHVQRCPMIVRDTFEKCISILTENGLI